METIQVLNISKINYKMQIKYAVMSCNSNPLYLDFWPIVSKVWKLKFDIEPILIYIEDQDKALDETYGKVIKIKPIPQGSIVLQSLFSRFWYLQFFKEDICILSDIDMIPLSLGFFKTSIKNVSPDKYVSMSMNELEFNSCYNIASGNKFKEILELEDSWEDQINVLNQEIYRTPASEHVHPDWSRDETYLNLKLQNKEIVRFVRGDDSLRIDRGNWKYDIPKLKIGMYYDCHSIRPYSKYKKEIDQMIKYFLES